MRTRILTIAFVTLLLTTGALLLGVRMFITGAAGFDDWVMRQVVGVAQAYLVPTIEFDDFEFAAPGTATYHGVRLTAPDGTRVVDAGELIVTLAELPRRGEPIVIEGITIRDGALRLVASPDDPDVAFKGLSPFVKKSAFKRQETLPREARLSETLRMRSITLDNAGVIFDPNDGQPPMRLDALTMTMTINPGTSDGKTWHALDIDIDRGALFKVAVDGRVDLDGLAVELKAMTLRVDVGSGSVAALPPQLQQILKDHDAQGVLEIHLSGAAALERWRESELGGAITIDRFNLALGEHRLPIDTGSIPFRISASTAVVGPTRLEIHGGRVDGVISADLARASMPAKAEWSIDGLDLREFLRTATAAHEPPKHAGLLSSFGSVSADLTGLPGTIDGLGELHITQGRLINFPGIQQINKALDLVTMSDGNAALRDRFDAEFQLTATGVRIQSSQLESQSLLARGTGMLYYNRTLDLRLNAGPMEKLESVLGKVGKAIGSITDQLVTYHVTGTLSDPKLTVKPMGLGF
jgi:hypothetical protein